MAPFSEVYALTGNREPPNTPEARMVEYLETKGITVTGPINLRPGVSDAPARDASALQMGLHPAAIMGAKLVAAAARSAIANVGPFRDFCEDLRRFF